MEQLSISLHCTSLAGRVADSCRDCSAPGNGVSHHSERAAHSIARFVEQQSTAKEINDILICTTMYLFLFPLDDATLMVFAAVFCLQASDANPRANSLRLVCLLAYILGVLVMSSYSAFLTSSFTVIRPRIPFTSLQGLLEDGTYEFQPLKNSAILKYIQAGYNLIFR